MNSWMMKPMKVAIGTSSSSSESSNHQDEERRGNQYYYGWQRLLFRRRRCAPDNNCSDNHHDHRGSLLLVSGLVFVVMITAGFLLLGMHLRQVRARVQQDAIDLAEETTSYFINAFNRAIMPLFSLAQFMVEIPTFRHLPQAIGPAYEADSLPFMREGYRNLTNSPCQDPTVTKRYNEIASTIKENANMPGILLQLYMMPQAVTCLVYPLQTTVVDASTDTKVVMDVSDQLGLDLLVDPKLRYHGEFTLNATDMVIVGPITLRNCVAKECHPIVKSAIVARLPIKVPDHTITLPTTGRVVNRWGFVVATINWKQLVEQSNIYKRFKDINCEFSLIRKDRLYAAKTEDIVLAQSDGFVTSEEEHNNSKKKMRRSRRNRRFEDTVAITTSVGAAAQGKEDWTIVIQCNTQDHATTIFRIWVSILIVVLSLIVSVLVYTILKQKQDLISKSKSQEARVETERNMTAYFAHELRNPISAIESALVAMETEFFSGDTENNEQQQLLPPQEQLPLLLSSLQEYHHGMRLCSSFMVRIMNNLCDVRQLEEGRMEFHKSSMELDKLIMETHSMLLPSVKNGVELKYEIHNNVLLPPPSCNNSSNNNNNNCVMGDYHRLLQVLTNVTSNAIKYTSSGSITLSVRWEEEGGDDDHDKNTNNNDNNNFQKVRFECADTGPGIPKQEQSQLFQRFVRRGGAPGSGLGLAISKHIVDSMNGTIYFESDPTVRPSATCVVILPMEKAAVASTSFTTPTTLTSAATATKEGAAAAATTNTTIVEQSSAASISSASKNNKGKTELQVEKRNEIVPKQSPIEEELRILIVDDIKVNRLMLKKRIQKCVAPNAIIEERETGEAALEVLIHPKAAAVVVAEESSPAGCTNNNNNETFHVIIMDQYMESAGGALLGTDAIIALRRVGVSSMIIGSSGNDIAEDFLRAGADTVWQKPLPSNNDMIQHLRAGLGLVGGGTSTNQY